MEVGGAWAGIQSHESSNMHECPSALSTEKTVGGKKLTPKEKASVVILASSFYQSKKRSVLVILKNKNEKMLSSS